MSESQVPSFVADFRSAAPYVHAFRGRTFVVVFGGEMVEAGQFQSLAHDLALLNSLGVRLVLVHGARPQIEARLAERGLALRYQQGRRVTDAESLGVVKEAVGVLRLEIEGILSMGLAQTPMAGANLRVVSGNLVTARPLGVLDGVDYAYTGAVRRVDTDGIRGQLETGTMVLLHPLGYSPTGELFNLYTEDVAEAASIALGADKLLFLMDSPGIRTGGSFRDQLSPADAQTLLESGSDLSEEETRHLRTAVSACRGGVARAHLLSRHADGAILQELFTRDGVGTLVASDSYETTRPATPDDLGGILELVRPLAEAGVLLGRGQEHLESELDGYWVMERDGLVVGTAALYVYPEQEAGELACLVVHPDYRDGGRGERLLETVAETARARGLRRLFVLTTQTAHWFRERGFQPGDPEALPPARRALYDTGRCAKVLERSL